MATSVTGINDGSGFGVKGSSASPQVGKGVEGISNSDDGVFGQTIANHKAGVHGVHLGHGNAIAVLGEVKGGIAAVKGLEGAGTGINEPSPSGVWGDSTGGVGVVGTSTASQGVWGESTVSEGVRGVSHSLHGGVVGVNDNSGPGAAVFGTSTNGEGVHGETNAPGFIAGVSGIALNSDGLAPGVLGQSVGKGPGVVGKSTADAAVIGFRGDPALRETTVSNDGGRAGVFGASDAGAGVVGYTRSDTEYAVFAFGGIRAFASTKPYAGYFQGTIRVEGDVEVKRDVLLSGADCAEEFQTSEAAQIEPGSVVVLGQNGELQESAVPYDTKVAGVVSGAGSFRPAIILDRKDSPRRVAVALVGKVYCKVDAQYAPISVGDLLTSSPTAGHAMRATDPSRSFGSVIGKSLGSLSAGTGLVPMLVCMQ